MMRWTGFWIIVVLLTGCGEANRGALVSNSPIVIPLGSSPANVSGFTWPESHGNSCESVTIQRESYVSLVFPGGRRWAGWSRLTLADQEKGVVYRAVITPLRETASFDAAVRGLNRTIDELGVEADSPIRKKLAALHKEPPEWSPFHTPSCGCEIESGIDLYVEIRPARDTNRWFLSYEFYMSRGRRARSR
jgi:hypothetical protein